jgi:hypothetical protein
MIKFFLPLCLLALSGCASVSVKNSEFPPISQKPTLPAQIFVRPFVVSPEALRVDRDGAELRQFEQELSNQFADKLTERLSKYIAPARRVTPTAAIRAQNAWLVEGQFDRINQGSRLLRSVIGFGAGGTKTETTSFVYRIDGKKKQLIAKIQTTGGSNAQPGAIFSGPLGAAPRLIVIATTSGLTADAGRTARMITATLSEYLAEAGAPLPARALKPKRLGEVPGLDGD